MQEMFTTNFSMLDWGIVAIYLVGVGLAGVIVNRYVHNVSDYMVGGRGAGTALNMSTYIGTGLGLVTIMYVAIDAFSKGFSYMMIPLIGVVIALFVGSTGFVIRRLRTYELVTIPEFFEKRFDKFIKTVKHLGPASLTEILCLYDPKRYGVWNDRSRKALQILGFDDLPLSKYYISGKEYIRINETLKQIAKELQTLGHERANLITVDLFLWLVWKEGLMIICQNLMTQES